MAQRIEPQRASSTANLAELNQTAESCFQSVSGPVLHVAEFLYLSCRAVQPLGKIDLPDCRGRLKNIGTQPAFDEKAVR
jgi:hypothetical protein